MFAEVLMHLLVNCTAHCSCLAVINSV